MVEGKNLPAGRWGILSLYSSLNADPGYIETLATLIWRWQNSIQC